MTFSLAGRCARTGMLGAVIATSSPAVGARCVHARAGLGVVLTQNRTDPRLGPRGLALLADGCTPGETIAALAASTADIGWRQLAVLHADGRTAHYSGCRITSIHAGISGRDCVAAGNILRDASVPGAMAASFEASAQQPLPTRLLGAISAGDAAGGEKLPLRSAALLVVDRQSFAYVDLRIDAAVEPIAALQALWEEYAPQAEDYVVRAVSPGVIPPLVS